MREARLRRMRTAFARAEFLRDGTARPADVPEVVAASWARSKAAGVDETHMVPSFTDDFDRDCRLIRCAKPVLAQLGSDTEGMDFVIALTNRQAQLVHRQESSRELAHRLDAVGFAPGFVYAEASVGTNGVGTVLESGAAVSVVGPEHYAQDLHEFACTGAPIVDPVTGRVEGILDLSTLARFWSPAMQTLARSAARDIGRNLLLDRNRTELALFEAYAREDARTTRSAVLVFGTSTSMLNSVAQTQFSTQQQLMIRSHAGIILTRRDRARDTIELTDGRRVRLLATRISLGGETAGFMVVVDEMRHSAGPSMETGPVTIVLEGQQAGMGSSGTPHVQEHSDGEHEPLDPSCSPAWKRCTLALRTLVATGEHPLVLGEAGTGKVTVLADIFRAMYPGAPFIVLETDSLDPPAVVELPRSASPEAPMLVVARNIESLSPQRIEILRSLLTTLTRRKTMVAATYTGMTIDNPGPLEPLLAHFTESVTIPPLRHRQEDMDLIVDSILKRIAPQRRVQLSHAARRTLARFSWPENVHQLTDALSFALKRRPVGTIKDEDLPAFCHATVPRRLSRLEVAERDAITEALHELDGNRQAAASRLGMSRSSLYRKLHAYGISL